MNDLTWIPYTAHRMYCDVADMSVATELAHRRLFDLLCILGKPIMGDDDTIREAGRVRESDWLRVRGELQRKGWHRTQDGGWTHDGTMQTIEESAELHAAKVRQTAAARAKRSTDTVTDIVTDNATTPATENVTSGTSTSTIRHIYTGGDGEIEPPPGFPKSEAEAIAAGQIVGVPKELCATCYHKAVSRGYRDAKGVTIANFASLLKIEQAYDSNRRNTPQGNSGHAKPDRNAGTYNADGKDELLDAAKRKLARASAP